MVVPRHEVVVVVVPPQGVGRAHPRFVAVFFVLAHVVLKVPEGYFLLRSRRYRPLDSIHVVKHRFVGVLPDPPGDVHRALYLCGFLVAAQRGELLEQRRRLAFGKQLRGAYRVSEELQLGKLEIPCHKLVGSRPAHRHADIHAVFLQRLHVLGKRLAALGYPVVRENVGYLVSGQGFGLAGEFLENIPQIKQLEPLCAGVLLCH